MSDLWCYKRLTASSSQTPEIFTISTQCYTRTPYREHSCSEIPALVTSSVQHYDSFCQTAQPWHWWQLMSNKLDKYIIINLVQPCWTSEAPALKSLNWPPHQIRPILNPLPVGTPNTADLLKQLPWMRSRWIAPACLGLATYWCIGLQAWGLSSVPVKYSKSFPETSAQWSQSPESCFQ
jgi:hypothetical protein